VVIHTIKILSLHQYIFNEPVRLILRISEVSVTSKKPGCLKR